ncbi:hypothetical protein J6590_080024 [Homalodisca vitripennis]|nr:hypothetical protein J6590_080024 [Homalodisca vitripennis]
MMVNFLAYQKFGGMGAADLSGKRPHGFVSNSFLSDCRKVLTEVTGHHAQMVWGQCEVRVSSAAVTVVKACEASNCPLLVDQNSLKVGFGCSSPSGNAISRRVCDVALETKSTPVQLAQKVEKSIGARILSVSMKKGNIKPLVKQATGSSTVTKSSITKAKHSNTPGSVYKTKFGVAKKPPNFKSLHKKLFQNMESIDENKQRTMARAQALISSPAVPRVSPLGS